MLENILHLRQHMLYIVLRIKTCKETNLKPLPNVLYGFVWDIYQMRYVSCVFLLSEVGQFVPNKNNKRCPETGVLLIFEDLLEFEE